MNTSRMPSVAVTGLSLAALGAIALAARPPLPFTAFSPSTHLATDTVTQQTAAQMGKTSIGCATVATQGDPLLIRTGPERNFLAVGSLNPGTQVEAIERSQDGQWWYVQVPATEQSGWAAARYLRVTSRACPVEQNS
jgi:uncharacterized protein YraI